MIEIESRKQRLSKLERRIIALNSEMSLMGFGLIQIEREELFLEDGFKSFEEYLSKRFIDDFSVSQARIMMRKAREMKRLSQEVETLRNQMMTEASNMENASESSEHH